MSAKALVIRRIVPAPRPAVFEAWTKAEIMSLWFAALPSWRCEATADVRVGGRYRLVMREPTGVAHEQFGEYREIEPVSRLVFTWTCPEVGVADSVVTVQFEDRGGELRSRSHIPCRMTARSAGATRKAGRAVWQGWTDSLQKREIAMSAIKDDVKIETTEDKAYRALSTQAGYLGWWSKDCEIAESAGGESRLKFDKSGSIVNMRFRTDVTDGKVATSSGRASRTTWIHGSGPL